MILHGSIDLDAREVMLPAVRSERALLHQQARHFTCYRRSHGGFIIIVDTAGMRNHLGLHTQVLERICCTVWFIFIVRVIFWVIFDGFVRGRTCSLLRVDGFIKGSLCVIPERSSFLFDILLHVGKLSFIHLLLSRSHDVYLSI